jgi:hypothetical protein
MVLNVLGEAARWLLTHSNVHVRAKFQILVCRFRKIVRTIAVKLWMSI